MLPETASDEIMTVETASSESDDNVGNETPEEDLGETVGVKFPGELPEGVEIIQLAEPVGLVPVLVGSVPGEVEIIQFAAFALAATAVVVTTFPATKDEEGANIPGSD